MNYKKYFAFLLIASFLILNSCTKSETLSRNESVEQEENTSVVTEASPDETTETSSTANAASTEEQIAAIIGTTQESWLPKVIADKDLKRGMNPEEVSKVLPGAEEVSQFGFSEIRVEDVPGLQKYELYFSKNNAGEPQNLRSIQLVFDPSLKNELSFAEMAKEVAKKYGEYRETITEGEVSSYYWIGPELSPVTLDNFGGDFAGYKLNVTLVR
ncbi:MAG: hypothetical protein WBG70_23425 [Spirulinaceae cyanobacterium]